MADFPALPLWTDAYLADTAGTLTAEEHGIYLVMLMFAWRNENCSISRDDVLERVKSVCKGISGQRAAAIVDRLMAKFWSVDNSVDNPVDNSLKPGTQTGMWCQKRLRRERDVVEMLHEKRSRSGREGNAKRWGNNDLEIAPRSHPHPHLYLNKKAFSNREKAVETCSTCGGQLPNSALGRVSGCACPGDPEWKPRPTSTASVRGEFVEPEVPVKPGDLAALLAGLTASLATPTQMRGDGVCTVSAASPPAGGSSWVRLADGRFVRKSLNGKVKR